MEWSTREYLIALNMLPGIGGRRLQALQKHFGSLARAWSASPRELCRISGIGPKTAAAACAARRMVCPAEEERWAGEHGAVIITAADKAYPAYLRRLAVPPPVLYVVGELPQQPGIAVVGTRRPSRSGVAQAKLFSGYLAGRGEVIISGFARGIDYFAHCRALEVGGKTVAVLGSNLADIYPGQHRALVKKVGQNGAVVTEFSSKCSTVRGNFPRRNRIIAGLSKGILVVQAPAKSGALITADWGLELGLDIWAIPGEISDPLREGCHNLIKEGAYLAAGPQDIVGLECPGCSVPSVKQMHAAGHHANEIAASLNRPIADVLAEIFLLEVGRSGGH